MPEASSGDNDIVVTQVHYDTGLINSDNYQAGAIDYFPDEYEYLVALYAGIKSLQNALSAKDSDLPSDLTNIVADTVSTSLPTYSGPTSFNLPVPPAGVDVDFSSIGSVESFVSPVFSIPSLGTISSMSLPSVPIGPSISSNSVTITGTAPKSVEYSNIASILLPPDTSLLINQYIFD